MKITTETYRLLDRWDGHVHTAWLRFSDYDKIVHYLTWRRPVRYDVYTGGLYNDKEGIVAVFDDGTEERFSFIRLRDVLEKNWIHLKRLLSEPGQDLDEYTEDNGAGVQRETLSLKCVCLRFQIGPRKGLSFDRIWGKVKFEYDEEES